MLDGWISSCLKNTFYKNLTFEKLYLAHILIFDGTTNMNKKGTPIGNYTSQFFANIYMNELDQYVKHILKCKYYVRYMDYFIILLKTKQECIEIKFMKIY